MHLLCTCKLTPLYIPQRFAGVSTGPLTLDAIDRTIIAELQTDARTTSRAISERVGVSDTTIRNRIERLESGGVIRGYQPIIDYERAGLERPIFFVCTAPIVDRAELARAALAIEGVVDVFEVMEGRSNIYVKAIAADADEITRIAKALDSRGVTIETESLIRNEHHQPYRPFQAEAAAEVATGDRTEKNGL